MSTLETLLIMDEDTQIRGLSYVFYFKSLKFSQVFIWSPTDAGKMLIGCDNNLPIRHRSVCVSDTHFFEKSLKMQFKLCQMQDKSKKFRMVYLMLRIYFLRTSLVRKENTLPKKWLKCGRKR